MSDIDLLRESIGSLRASDIPREIGTSIGGIGAIIKAVSNLITQIIKNAIGIIEGFIAPSEEFFNFLAKEIIKMGLRITKLMKALPGFSLIFTILTKSYTWIAVKLGLVDSAALLILRLHLEVLTEEDKNLLKLNILEASPSQVEAIHAAQNRENESPGESVIRAIMLTFSDDKSIENVMSWIIGISVLSAGTIMLAVLSLFFVGISFLTPLPYIVLAIVLGMTVWAKSRFLRKFRKRSRKRRKPIFVLKTGERIKPISKRRVITFERKKKRKK